MIEFFLEKQKLVDLLMISCIMNIISGVRIV